MIPFQPDRSWFECYWWDQCPGRSPAQPLRPPREGVTTRILRMVRRSRAGRAAEADAKPLPSCNGAGR
jgi:hypothetical protein